MTLSGQSFASRMAGALLTAAGLPNLITYNLSDYEDEAVMLASDSSQCERLRLHLTDVRKSGALFNTPLFVHDLEDHFRHLVQKLQEPLA